MTTYSTYNTNHRSNPKSEKKYGCQKLNVGVSECVFVTAGVARNTVTRKVQQYAAVKNGTISLFKKNIGTLKWT